jgi:type I restriction enzyme S subunit
MLEPRLDMAPAHWQIVRDILARHAAELEIWAFGSRARGNARQYSDLDLVIIGKQALPIAQRAALTDDFSESDLPWRVDIVDWATTDAGFRRIIERDKFVLQEATSRK